MWESQITMENWCAAICEKQAGTQRSIGTQEHSTLSQHKNTALSLYRKTAHCRCTRTQQTVTTQEHSTVSQHRNTTHCHNTGTQHTVATDRHNAMSQQGNTAQCHNRGTQHTVATQEHSTLSLHRNTAHCHKTGTRHSFTTQQTVATQEHSTVSQRLNTAHCFKPNTDPNISSLNCRLYSDYAAQFLSSFRDTNCSVLRLTATIYFFTWPANSPAHTVGSGMDSLFRAVYKFRRNPLVWPWRYWVAK